MQAYKILSETDASRLSALVNAALQDGWTLYGDPVVTQCEAMGPFFTQAIVRQGPAISTLGTPQQILQILNHLAHVDPQLMTNLVEHRVHANKSLLHSNSNVIVDDNCRLGMLGVINGILIDLCGHVKLKAHMSDDTKLITHFTLDDLADLKPVTPSAGD